MGTLPNIDPARIGEEIFYNVFYHIFHSESARQHLEFSQINQFSNSAGLPGWNLWFQENNRTYQLALIQADIVSDNHRRHAALSNGGPIIEGRLAVRYFPDANAREIEDFSCTEIMLRQSSHFDHTGTPTLTAQESIDDSCFVIGYLDFRTNIQRSFLELECIAPNRWKDVRVDGLYLTTHDNVKHEIVAPGIIDRYVPGWDLAFFLFDKLISGCCYAFKTSPCAAVYAQKKWFRFNINKANESNTVIDPDIVLYHLVIGLEINMCSNGDRHQSAVDHQAYIQGVCNLLASDDFVLPEVCSTPKCASDTNINPGWWEVKKLILSDDIESETVCCCYNKQ